MRMVGSQRTLANRVRVRNTCCTVKQLAEPIGAAQCAVRYFLVRVDNTCSGKGEGPMSKDDQSSDELLASQETLRGYDRWAASYDSEPNALVTATAWVLD